MRTAKDRCLARILLTNESRGSRLTKLRSCRSIKFVTNCDHSLFCNRRFLLRKKPEIKNDVDILITCKIMLHILFRVVVRRYIYIYNETELPYIHHVA